MGIPLKAAEEPKKTLVDLDRECRDLVAQLSTSGEDISEGALKVLETAELALCEKVDAYSHVMARLRSEESFWSDQESKCYAAKKAFKSAQERLKERMRWVLTQREDKSLQGQISRFFLARATPRVEINLENLPDEYKVSKIEISADRAKVESALKAGKIVPGAVMVENFALREGRPR